jgi:hypothetical protein
MKDVTRQRLQLANEYFVDFAESRVRRESLAFLRAALSAIAILMYLANYRDRHTLIGPRGIIAAGDYAIHAKGLLRTFSLLTLPGLRSSNAVFEVVYILAVVVAVANLLVGGRLLAFAHLVFFLSIVNANPWFGDGGETLERLLLVMLVFADTRAAFSLLPRGFRSDRHFTNLLHNAAAILVVYQVACVYLYASLWKVSGTLWRNGTALWYILRSPQYARFSLPDYVVGNSLIVLALTYGTILIQLCVVPAIVFRRGRRVLLGLLVVMHLAIAFEMGLVEFGFIMIAADVAALMPSPSGRRRRDDPEESGDDADVLESIGAASETKFTQLVAVTAAAGDVA